MSSCLSPVALGLLPLQRDSSSRLDLGLELELAPVPEVTLPGHDFRHGALTGVLSIMSA